MCRFMMVKSTYPVLPRSFLSKFSNMCFHSKAYDGDWQGDGWGISCLVENDQSYEWCTEKSTSPIWEDKNMFAKFPQSNLFIAHARSASFPQHKGVVDFNQPFMNGKYGFVFNGLVKGVTFPFPVQGNIGSQKIWALLQTILKEYKPDDALYHIKELLTKHAKSIQALNIGLFSQSNMYIYSYFTEHPEYYRLYYHESSSLKIIASNILDGFGFKPVEEDKVLVI